MVTGAAGEFRAAARRGHRARPPAAPARSRRRVGLLLLGAAAGAPFLPKLAQLARGDVGFAVGLMVLLMVMTIGYLPLALPFMLPGVTVDPWAIAKSLLLLMLLPLGSGSGSNARLPDHRPRR